MMNTKKRDFFTALLAGTLSILAYCAVTHIWNMDLNVPLSYAGDLSGLLNNIKAVLREESWWSFQGLGAPFHTNMWRQLMDAYIPNGIIFGIAKITNSVGYGVNLYYILSFGLSGMCAYYMLRRGDIKREYAIVGAILYALIPGHFQRGEQHIYVGSCFSIPLIIITAMDILEGRVVQEVPKGALSIKQTFAGNQAQAYGLLYFAIVSFCTIYYGVFSLMLLTFCFVYDGVTRRQRRCFVYYFQYVFLFLICAGLVYLPQVLANHFDPCLEDVKIVSRYVGDVEYYGGKLIQYVMPVSGHRIGILSYLRQGYDASFPLVNENGTASLGLVMSIGFIAGILACFFSREKWAEKIELYGKIELFLFFVSTIGGLGAFVAFITYSIRCYNRFSYFIGAVAMIISMKILQELCERITKRIQDKRTRTAVIWCLCLLILTIALLDQTTAGMAYSKEYGAGISAEYANDANFVNLIEQYEGENANILVFPVMNGQEATVSTTIDGHNGGYGEQMMFIHSSTSNWSTGSKAGEAGERWLNWLRSFSTENQIGISVAAGFSGVAIYYGGYNEQKLNDVIEALNNICGEPDIRNENGTWAYYSYRDIDLLSAYSDEEREALKHKCLYEYQDWYIFDAHNLYYTAGNSETAGIYVEPGATQYGPYNSFSSGLYEVKVFGENLDLAEFDCASNGVAFKRDVEEATDTYLQYLVTFGTDVDAVEFRTFNVSEETVVVNRIEVNRIDKFSTSGIWDQESWGRWAEKDCAIVYDYQGEETSIGLRLLIATPAEDGAAVTVACGDYQETLITNGQTAANLSIPITAGENEIRLSSSAPDITAEGDPRNMNIQILDMALIYDGIEIRINNPQ